MHSSLAPSPSTLEKEPARHERAADAPTSQYEPGVQSRQAVAPALGWYVPTTHLAHAPRMAVTLWAMDAEFEG